MSVILGNLFIFLGLSIYMFFKYFLNLKMMILKILSYFSVCLNLDWVSWMFMSVLLMMLGSVFKFSSYYMGQEILRSNQFKKLILLFVLSMIMLMVSKDWISLMIGWDWLGMISFFLVCYYKKDISWSGSLKTYFTKRLGDGIFIFLISVLVLKFFYVGMDYSMSMVIFFILLCQTKSAQLPFSAWLPAAMAAPTPVSALVHSSTLVTAGVFMLIRMKESLFVWKKYILVMGLMTLFLGSFSACGSFDMKKIMAFSTLSHLGFMFVCLSSGKVLLSFFHLICHACFKAMLFMSGGMLMLKKNHSQDFRQIGFSFSNMIYMWMSMISVLSLCGFPFFSGFFSKDSMMEFSFWNMKVIFYMIFLISMLFSCFYSFRLMKKLLKMKWQVKKMNKSQNNFIFILVLLMFSVGFGLVKFSYFKTLNFMFSKCFMKIMIYMLMILGFKMSYFNFKKMMASSILFMDSLGGGAMKFIGNKKMIIYKKIDQGLLPYFSEKMEMKKTKNFLSFLSSKIFYYFWFFLLMVFLFN